jgi:cellulose synthase/poly-beta-1,6-N-acetylglucosamine synthase-like glycosyltransferase
MNKYSIIIPVKSINDYVRETVPYIQALMGHEWELFIIPNNPEDNEWTDDKRVNVVESGRVGPADKRDLGAQRSSGDILVFLDDDSYPEPNILEIANEKFEDPNVIAVGGPGVTPHSDGFWQRVSGAVFLSKYTGGAPERYASVGKAKEIDDWPSVNLMARKDVFLSVGGFDSKYWPGEDTMLCLKLKNTGKKLIYEPSMIVWHHRRGEFLAHIKQVGAYGLHRGFFARKYPDTSFRLKYFLPSFLFLFFLITIGVLFFENEAALKLLVIGWSLYATVIFLGTLEAIKFEKPSVVLAAILYIVPTHFIYGIKFLFGYFMIKSLTSELR